MFDRKRLNELEAAQNLLVLQSDLQRAHFGLELASLHEALPWAGRSPISFLGSPLVVAAGVAGLLLSMRKFRSALKWMPMALTAWRMVSRFRSR
jgi:hypothetical protein